MYQPTRIVTLATQPQHLFHPFLITKELRVIAPAAMTARHPLESRLLTYPPLRIAACVITPPVLPLACLITKALPRLAKVVTTVNTPPAKIQRLTMYPLSRIAIFVTLPRHFDHLSSITWISPVIAHPATMARRPLVSPLHTFPQLKIAASVITPVSLPLGCLITKVLPLPAKAVTTVYTPLARIQRRIMYPPAKIVISATQRRRFSLLFSITRA